MLVREVMGGSEGGGKYFLGNWILLRLEDGVGKNRGE